MRSRRYLWLIVAVALGALGLSAWGRGTGRRRASAPAPPTNVVSTALHVRIRDDGLTPAAAQVPRGERILLSITNEGRTPATLSLRGYEGRLAIVRVAPGETLRRALLADLPGEDFPWLLNGLPAGKLTVSGSHLIEGHR